MALALFGVELYFSEVRKPCSPVVADVKCTESVRETNKKEFWLKSTFVAKMVIVTKLIFLSSKDKL